MPLFKQVNVIEETHSTNDTIKEKGYYQDRSLLLVINQTAGRGTNKRTFYSEKSKGIYASCIIDLNTINHQGSFIPIIMACAIANTLKELGFTPSLKWVNDVLINQKKVAGILCEKSANDSMMVVGVGLNVYAMNLPKEIKHLATTLEENSSTPLDINTITISLFKQFSELLQIDSNQVIDRYHHYYQDMNKKIVVKTNHSLSEGIIVGINSLGALDVMINNTILSIISSEQIIEIQTNQ